MRHLQHIFVSALLIFTGCTFSEKSFPLDPAAIVPIRVAAHGTAGQALPLKQWTPAVHRQLAGLLPDRGGQSLTGDALRRPNGRPVDLERIWGIPPKTTDDLLLNTPGLGYTAQVIPAAEPRGSFASWPGFQRITVSMADGTKLSAVMAEPTGADLGQSYVVVMHGLFGRQYGHDQYNVCETLRRFGHHVVGVEMRGHGMTEELNSTAPMTFGPDEVQDLLQVGSYLRTQLGAKRVGLLGWSLTAHQGLLTAWCDSDRAIRSHWESPILSSMPEPGAQSVFDSMLLFSPAINLVSLCDDMDQPRQMLFSPVRSAFQDRAAKRLQEAGQPRSRTMWSYVEYELKRSHWMSQYPGYPQFLRDEISFIDFTGDNWRRLETIRFPVLLVQAADDPLVGSAQAAVDLCAPVDNPNVSLILLLHGGHAGFSSACCNYEYSLIKAFFDPATAPWPVVPPSH